MGLNVKNFNACLASGKFNDKVQADVADGSAAGVQGTPTSFIVRDGKVVDTIGGALPEDQVMQKINAALAGTTAAKSTVMIRPLSSEDHTIGSLNAKIIIVEYSDLECPFCKVFHATMHKIVKSFPNGEVAWVYRHYPIPQLHPKAPHEAEATECAWEQQGNEGFWKYADKVFEITPSNNGLDESLL